PEPKVEEVEEAIPEPKVEEVEEAIPEPKVEEVEEVVPEPEVEEVEEVVPEPEVEEVEEAEEVDMDAFKDELEEVISVRAAEEVGEPIEAPIEPTEPSDLEFSRMMSEALIELGRIDEALETSVPLTKADWIQALPAHVKERFFEEELRQLEVEDLEDLSRLTPDQLEELMGSIADEAGTDRIVIDDSAKLIPEALQEVSRPLTKSELIDALPSHVRESISDKRLQAMSEVDLEELAKLSPEDFQTLLKTLSKHKDWQDI
ncbi:MAG: hypothetical protein ACE5H4_14015, partial [Candidatus Thorarchaeota archaeon]